jgi:protein gp37
MAKTKIEWVRNQDGTQGYTLNPVKGLCPMGCSYCYARRMYKRFKWNPEIRYEDVFWYPGLEGKPGDKYFVGSTIELFGDWIEDWWLENIFMWIRSYPQRTFIFLTKQPQNLIKWSPFPDNCWVGVSATNSEDFSEASDYLRRIRATVKFISFEPLLGLSFGTLNLQYWFIEAGINWVIIGRQTPVFKKTEPRIEWIKEIVEACDKAGVPVFLKDNLKSLLPITYPPGIGSNKTTPFYRAVPLEHKEGIHNEWEWELRQEMPK